MWRRRLGLLAVLGFAALSATLAVDEASSTTPALVTPPTAQPSVGPRWPLTSRTQRKKDLGTLGAVLSVLMMAIIVLLGAGITAGYLYKRGRDLRWQHEQRVYEREMHRVTLPLSAFANPVCEMVEENTLTPAQEPEEGQAGTPGA